MIAVWILGLITLGFVFWRFFFFFRNPRRKVPLDDRHVLSPADGRILYVRPVSNRPDEPILSIKGKNIIRLTDLMHLPDEGLKDRTGYLIGIFMSPFDVHYNRAPIRGFLHKIAHDFPSSPWTSRTNLGMFNALSNLVFGEKPYHHDCDYLIHNERASYTLQGKDLLLYVTQIADQLVNQIVTYKHEEQVEQGEVFSLVRMGSQVDVFLPDRDRFEIRVAEGQRVKAGLSVLAALRDHPEGATPG